VRTKDGYYEKKTWSGKKKVPDAAIRRPNFAQRHPGENRTHKIEWMAGGGMSERL